MALSSVLWDGVPTAVSGNTPFGYYDDDPGFEEFAQRSAKWAGRRLGYPSVDVELESEDFYNCIEDAIYTYTSEIQRFIIRENMMSLYGTSNDINSSTYVNYSTKPVIPKLDTMIKISDDYGEEVGVGGDITWHKSQIILTASQQNYDLNELIAVPSASGNDIEIKRVYHHQPVAYGYGLSGVYNAPGVLGTAGQAGTYGLLGNFGWEGLAAGGVATGLSYTLMPVYEDILRMQAVEFNFQMRRSGYSFEIRNNQLRIFPVPLAPQRLWIEWIYTKDKKYGSANSLSGSEYMQGSTSQSVTTNLADAPFELMPFNKINAPGKKWILEYYLASCKEVLGEARSKYQSIPIPNNEVVLNGDSLKQEAQNEKEQLITRLREDLERTSNQTQTEIQSEMAENLQNTLNKVPMGMFVH